MSGIHILVVEDEAVVGRRLARLLRQINTNIASIEHAEDFSSASAAFAGRTNRIVFLDLNLSGIDGFHLLRLGLAHGWRTVVVSAHVERAIEAFELGVIDFVPKPFSLDRLKLAFARATAITSNERLRFLVALHGSGTALVPLDQIIAIHGADDYSQIETASGQLLLHRKSLQTLADELPPSFMRTHRSHIVNLQFARALERCTTGGWHLHLTHGNSVRVSRAAVNALRKLLV